MNYVIFTSYYRIKPSLSFQRLIGDIQRLAADYALGGRLLLLEEGALLILQGEALPPPLHSASNFRKFISFTAM